jgi:hypothetical protein
LAATTLQALLLIVAIGCDGYELKGDAGTDSAVPIAEDDSSSPTDTASSSDTGSEPDTGSTPDTGTSRPLTPIYVTLVGHVEDHESLWICPQWTQTRDGLLSWANVLEPYTTTFNLQIDYPFMAAMNDCELPEMRAETGGMNVLKYLESEYGWEFDPHQEGGYEGVDETPDDYADIHWILSRLVDHPTDTVGGFIWNDQDQLDQYESGYTTSRIHSNTWTPDLLTMAVHYDHHLSDFSQDNNTSGMWHPSGSTEEAFNTHDASRRLPYIGTGLQHSNWSGSGRCDFHHSIEYAGAVSNMIERGDLASDQIYTATMAFPSSVMLNEEKYERAIEILEDGQALVNEGRIQIASYTDVHAIWQSEYDSEPNILSYDQIDPEEYTCDEE